jgi:AbrB family looped-hinge helix DNA binding protein
MKELFTSVTRKGQITLPIEIRRSLDIKEGDKVAVSLIESADGRDPQVVLRPVRSIAEMTFGAIPPRKRPEDFVELRHHFEEGMAQDVLTEMNS